MDRNHISDISKTNAHGLVGGETTATTSKSYKWILVAMLSCAFFFHQADRALFGLLTIPIQKDLGLTDVQIGWINSVLSWTLADRAVTIAKRGDLAARRLVASRILDPKAVQKLFDKIAPAMKDRKGGYTRIVKLGTRKGDGAETCILQWTCAAEVSAPAAEEPAKEVK